MPFRTPEVRQQQDIARLEGPGYGLAEGEWVAYWTAFPHSLATRVTTGATKTTIDPVTGNVAAIFDAGEAANLKVSLGIVDWHLLDENREAVPWDQKRARELIDGLPPETYRVLQRIISTTLPPDGAEVPTPPELGAPVEPENPNSETVGNDSGES